MQIPACEKGLEHAHPRRAMRLTDLILHALDDQSARILGADRLIRDICLDSREAGPDSAFVAVRGAADDGFRFSQDALARGAVAIVADRDVPPGENHSVARIADTRGAASRLAAVLYGLTDAQAAGYRMTGVTGTNGKSTIAFMLRAILNAAARPCALIGTIRYDLVARTAPAPLTTPDAVTLVRLLMEAHAADARDAVLEVSSHSLEQGRTAGLQFNTAVFTNLTQDHLDYHGSLDAYLAAKRRLFESLDAGAAAVVNADDAHADAIVAGCRGRIVRYGLNDRADCRGRIIETSIGGSRFVMEYDGTATEFAIHLVGAFNVSNALAAIAAARSSDIDMESIQQGLASLRNVPGRVQRIDTGDRGFAVLVDYAHTDDALRNVLSGVRPLTPGRLWCVFGCGGDRDRTKRPLMAQAVAQGADRFVITSDNPRTEDPLAIIRDIEAGLTPEVRRRCEIEADRRKAIALAIDQLAPGDTLVIAGKGHEDYQIIGHDKTHFDDVEVAMEALGGARTCVR